MVLISLLLLALIFVVVGVVLASVGWLIASLAVSVVAAALLLRSYLQTRQRARGARSVSSADEPRAERSTVDASSPPGSAAAWGQAAMPPDTADISVWVVDGYPEYHVEGCGELDGLPAEAVPYEQAVEDGFQPCVVCNPDRALLPAAAPTGGDTAATQPAAGRSHTSAAVTTHAAPGASRQVLVIDGFPDYHAAGCRLLLGHDSVSIPLEQAVEDGFSPCAACRPDAEDESTEARPGQKGGVWVVDGYPDYHREGCPSLAGLPAEMIPHEQAVEDGFAECAVCTPDSKPTLPQAADDSIDSTARAAGGSLAEVWVADGYPDYHRAGCAELNGLSAEEIPHDQAVEDGFAPCPVCRPETPVTQSGGERTEQDVWVVDGQPEYHRAGCGRLSGLPEEPIPYHQAVEDGFVPCQVCRPDDAESPGEAEPRPEPDSTDPEQ